MSAGDVPNPPPSLTQSASAASLDNRTLIEELLNRPDAFKELTIPEVGKLLKRLRWKSWLTIVAIIIFLLSTGAWGKGLVSDILPARGQDKDSMDRVKPRHTPIDKSLSSSSAQKEYPWITPNVAFLEDEAIAEINAGKWRESPVVLLETQFTHATKEFTLLVTSESAEMLTGYAFLIESENNSMRITFLPVLQSVADHRATLQIPVVEATQGTRLLLLLRLSSSKSLPSAPRELADLINLRAT